MVKKNEFALRAIGVLHRCTPSSDRQAVVGPVSTFDVGPFALHGTLPVALTVDKLTSVLHVGSEPPHVVPKDTTSMWFVVQQLTLIHPSSEQVLGVALGGARTRVLQNFPVRIQLCVSHAKLVELHCAHLVAGVKYARCSK